MATCASCPAPLGAKNRSGRCRRCVAAANAADPTWRERQRAGVLRHVAKAEVREALVGRLRLYARRADVRETRRRQGQRMVPTLQACATQLTAEQRIENGRKRTATVLAWCPEDRREAYRALTRKGIRAADARQLIEQDIAAAERRRVAALTPFERQLERVAAGARLVTKPVIRTADPAFTLGGVSAGML